MTTLTSGLYHISAEAQKGQGVVSRHPAEPSCVVSLALGGPWTPEPWQVEGYPDTGVYQLKHYGARTCPQKGLIFAFEQDDPTAGSSGWSIVPSTSVAGTFRIRSLADPTRGWILSEEDGWQVKNGRYSERGERPTERWIFTPVSQTGGSQEGSRRKSKN